MRPDESSFLIAPVIGSLLAAGCLGFALRTARRKRLIDNLPTSKTTGVFLVPPRTRSPSIMDSMIGFST